MNAKNKVVKVSVSKQTELTATFEDGTNKAYPRYLEGGLIIDPELRLLFLTAEEIYDFYLRPVDNEPRNLIRIILTRKIVGRYDIGDMWDNPIWNDDEKAKAFEELVRIKCVDALPAMGKLFLDDIFQAVYRTNSEELSVSSKYPKAIIAIGGEYEFDKIMHERILPFLSLESPKFSSKTAKKRFSSLVSLIVKEYGNIGNWYVRNKWWEFWKPEIQL